MLDRSIKPKPSGKINFTLPKISSFTLENKLSVFHIYKNTLPIVQVNLIIPSGSIYDFQNKNGISTLTSMLIDEGAGNLNSLEISDKIEILGSILNISSNKEFTTVSLLSLKENLDKSLELFSLIVQSPNFKIDDFKREIKRLHTSVIQLNDDPSYLASTELQKIIYKNSPYQYPASGTLESIDQINSEDISTYYKNKYSPISSYLIMVGDIDRTEAENFSEKYFANWKNSSQLNQIEIKTEKTNKVIVLVDKTDAAQSEIRVGHFSKGRKSNDFYSRTVLNSIFGGQFSSRINLNLREDKGYTYGAHSNYHYNQIGSTYTISTSVKTDHTIDSIKEILNELEKIKTDITEEELGFSKSYLIRRYPSLFETYSQLATNLSLLPLYNLGLDYFENYIDNIKEVEIDSVQKAANENILLDRLVIVIVGNKKILSPELSKLASQYKFDFELKS